MIFNLNHFKTGINRLKIILYGLIFIYLVQPIVLYIVYILKIKYIEKSFVFNAKGL